MGHLNACTAAAILLAVGPCAWAQDKTPPADSSTRPGLSTSPAPTESSAARDTSSTAPLCFEVSRFCIERSRAAPMKSDAASAPLDLSIRRDDMAWLVQGLNLSASDEESVEVKSKMLPSARPNIPGGPFAVFWAMRHPTQAWRIFTPSPTR